MQFGKRLRKLRKYKELTQEQLGRLIGVSESTISLYESNKREPDHETLHKLADFFNVSIDYLLGRVDMIAERKKPYIISGTGDATFGFDKDIPLEAQEEIRRYAEYVIWKHEQKQRKKNNEGK